MLIPLSNPAGTILDSSATACITSRRGTAQTGRLCGFGGSLDLDRIVTPQDLEGAKFAGTCKKCQMPALPINYGFCAIHRHPVPRVSTGGPELTSPPGAVVKQADGEESVFMLTTGTQQLQQESTQPCPQLSGESGACKKCQMPAVQRNYGFCSRCRPPRLPERGTQGQSKKRVRAPMCLMWTAAASTDPASPYAADATKRAPGHWAPP